MPSDPPPTLRLPRQVLFVRSLALVSGATIGIAVGATVFAGAGCGGCTGICGALPPPITDGGGGDGHADARTLDASDASGAEVDAGDGATGGGPLGAPPLPASWIA